MWVIVLVLLGLALGALLLVLGVIAAAIGALVALAHALPLLLIVAGAWLVYRAMRPSGRARRGTPTAPPRTPAAPRAPRSGPAERRAQPAEHAARRPGPPDRPRRELPIDVSVIAEQVRRKAEVLLGYADRFPPYSQDLHIVRQTAAEYLPRTIKAYLALPGVDDPVVGTRGKTALQELREQLDLMDAKLDEITRRLQQGDVDRLLANRRFLEDRFDLHEGTQPTETAGRGTDAA